MIKAIIFDIDGVLANSLDANTHFFKDIMHKAGYAHPTRDDIAKIFHMTRVDTIKFLLKTDSEKEVGRVVKIAEQVPYPVRLLKANRGVRSVVRTLSKAYRLAVVTSRVRNTTRSYFRFSGLKKYFRVVVTQNPDFLALSFIALPCHGKVMRFRS